MFAEPEGSLRPVPLPPPRPDRARERWETPDARHDPARPDGDHRPAAGVTEGLCREPSLPGSPRRDARDRPDALLGREAGPRLRHVGALYRPRHGDRHPPRPAAAPPRL